MAKWTQKKIIDDSWSIKECIDELYSLDEEKSEAHAALSGSMLKNSEVLRLELSSINDKIKLLSSFIFIICVASSIGFYLMYFK